MLIIVEVLFLLFSYQTYFTFSSHTSPEILNLSEQLHFQCNKNTKVRDSEVTNKIQPNS